MPFTKKIIYLLEATSICGGVKVVFEQAKTLLEHGLDVSVISKDPYPNWIDFKIPFEQVSNFQAIFKKEALFILTFFKHVIEAGKASALNNCIHLCQGYEGDYKEAQGFISQIEAAYRTPIKRITVCEMLSRHLYNKFGINAFNIGQAIDHDTFYPSEAYETNCQTKCVIMGSYNNSIKRINDALAAIAPIKKSHSIRLIRISLSDTKKIEQQVCPIDEYYSFLPPKEVAKILRSCHLLIMPSSEGEGFGLPVVEAMASGLPVIMTNIPSFNEITNKDYPIPLVEPKNISALRSTIEMVLADKKLMVFARKRGLEIAKQYNYENVAKKLLYFLERQG